MTKAVNNKFRNIMVCIDSYEKEIVKGRIYNPCIDGNVEFYGLMHFINILEELLETMNFPQAYEQKRKFQVINTESYDVKETTSEMKGELATFELKILFRQNASWQGTLNWVEKDQEECFRSALELFILMGSALAVPTL